jgi:hypothetical protein
MTFDCDLFRHGRIERLSLVSRILIMANTSSDSHAILQKLINNLSGDLRQLSNETKKKYPPIKEVGGIISVICVLCFDSHAPMF